jgi:hypothetical protein
VAYQQALKPSSAERPLEAGRDAHSWYLLDNAARKALRRSLVGRADELQNRLREGLSLSVPGVAFEESSESPIAASSSKETTMNALWYLARRVVRIFSNHREKPRLTCHYLLIALARHCSGVRYSLEYV